MQIVVVSMTVLKRGWRIGGDLCPFVSERFRTAGQTRTQREQKDKGIEYRFRFRWLLSVDQIHYCPEPEALAEMPQ